RVISARPVIVAVVTGSLHNQILCRIVGNHIPLAGGVVVIAEAIVCPFVDTDVAVPVPFAVISPMPAGDASVGMVGDEEAVGAGLGHFGAVIIPFVSVEYGFRRHAFGFGADAGAN